MDHEEIDKTKSLAKLTEAEKERGRELSEVVSGHTQAIEISGRALGRAKWEYDKYTMEVLEKKGLIDSAHRLTVNWVKGEVWFFYRDKAYPGDD